MTSIVPTRDFIDDEILKLLSTLRLPVSLPADDATFLRRVTLDLTGRLPSANQVKAFLADSNSKKRETLVDALLQSDEFNEYWTLQLAKLLRIRSQRADTQGALIPNLDQPATNTKKVSTITDPRKRVSSL